MTNPIFYKTKGEVVSFSCYTNIGSVINYYQTDPQNPQAKIRDFVVNTSQLSRTKGYVVSEQELKDSQGMLIAQKGENIYFGKKIDEEILNKLPADVSTYIKEGK